MRTTEEALDSTVGEGIKRKQTFDEAIGTSEGKSWMPQSFPSPLSTAMTYLSVCVLLEEAGVVVNEAGELGMVQEENKQEKLLEDKL